MEQERKKRLKPRGSYRLYRNYYIRNIYYIDLIDFSSKTNKWIQENIERNLKNFKKNKYDYVLVCIDGYSRYTMIRKLKNKTAKTVCDAMLDIIKTYGSPNYINCDKGSEFVNSTFKNKILKPYNIKMYHMNTSNKSVFAERVIRTLKEDIIIPFNNSQGVWDIYIDNAVKKHNNHKNSYTGYTPEQIFKEGYIYYEKEYPNNMDEKDKTPQYDIGSFVRIETPPTTLQKKSLTYKWSEKLYQINEIDTKTLPVMYILKDTENNTILKRKYYYFELLQSKYKPVQKSIIQTRKQYNKSPEALKIQAKSHRPVTRSFSKKKGFSKKTQW